MSKPLTAPKERLHLTEHYVVENDSYRKHFCRCVWKNRIVFPASLNEVHDFPWGGGAGVDFLLLLLFNFCFYCPALCSSARENIHVMQMCQQTTLLNDP